MPFASGNVDPSEQRLRCAPWCWAALAIATFVIAIAAIAAFYYRPGGFDSPRIVELTRDLERARQRYQEARGHADQARGRATAAQAKLTDLLAGYFSPGSDETDDAGPRIEQSKTPPAPNREHQELAERYRALVNRRNELLLRLTSAHPAVEDIELQLSDLKERLDDTPEFITPPRDTALATHNLEEQLARQKIRHREAAEGYSAAAASARRLDDAAAAASVEELAAIDRHLAVASNLSSALSHRDPRTPWIGPNIWLPLVFATGLALVIGGSIALVRQHLDSKLRTASDIESALAVPVLAIVPGVRANRTTGGTQSAGALLGKTTLALVVFAVVACLVQDPTLLVQWLRGG